MLHLCMLFNADHQLAYVWFGDASPAESDVHWAAVEQSDFRCAGLKALSLLAVRAKQIALMNGGERYHTDVILEGKKGSVAQTLYDLKSSEWSKRLFNNEQRKIYLPETRNMDGKRRQFFTIKLKGTWWLTNLRIGHGSPGSAKWFERAEDGECLEALRVALERAFQPLNGGALNGQGHRSDPTASRSYHLSRQLRVAVLLGSTNLPYTDAIFRALKQHMTTGPFQGPPPLVDRVKSLPDDATEVAIGQQLAWEFRESTAARSADYWVAIGSPACVALRRSYGTGQGEPEKLEPDKPLLALGVTNPATLALPIQAPHDRRVAVIRYGSGMAHYANLLDEIIFRDLDIARRHFAFIYTSGIKHDDGAAKELEDLPIVSSGRLKLCPFPTLPTAAELKQVCGNRIIWGWYSLEYLLKEGRLSTTDLADLVVVSTIQEHAQNGLSAVAVQPLDEQIGQLGAQLLLEDFTTGSEPGHSFRRRPVRGAPDYFWLNLEVLERWENRLGFQLSREVAQHEFCKMVYGARPGNAAIAPSAPAELVGTCPSRL